MRLMSFSITTEQMYAGTKDVTRRLGWWKLAPGEQLCAVEKAMGLRKGEHVKRIGIIEVVSIRQEQLWHITSEDVIREGFPEMSIGEFCAMFARSHGYCGFDTIINRIEFKRLYAVHTDISSDAAATA